MENITPQHKVLIFCAPSGAGKTTLTRAVMAKLSSLAFSVSATNRESRENEIDGVDYYFISTEEFKQKIENHEFVEYEEVYPGKFYGTLKSEVDRLTKEDKVIVFDVDVKGAVSLKKYFGDQALMIFIFVPLEDLEKRLIDRGTETPETLRIRLDTAKSEMVYEEKADVVIKNIDLNKAIEDSYNEVVSFLQTSR